MSYWLTDPELFLYAKGTGLDDVHLWRCKKPASSSSLVVPMKPDDFDYVSNVKNHLELIADLFDWDELDFKRLVEYIYEKRLLVNSQGFVIAELLHKVDKDGKKAIDDANEEDVPAIYIRSLDVLPLKPYIPKLRERLIPLRTVKYLGDINGKAAMMEEDSNVTKLTARVADLESENKTLIAGQVTMTEKVDDLESKNKTLEDKVTKLTADMVTQMNALTTLQQELKKIYANNKEAWMNDLTNSNWVGIEKFSSMSTYDNFIIIGQPGTFTVDDISTNVRATYWYKMIFEVGNTNEYKFIPLEDLIPNKEKARFTYGKWHPFKSNGKTYLTTLMQEKRYAYIRFKEWGDLHSFRSSPMFILL